MRRVPFPVHTSLLTIQCLVILSNARTRDRIGEGYFVFTPINDLLFLFINRSSKWGHFDVTFRQSTEWSNCFVNYQNYCVIAGEIYRKTVWIGSVDKVKTPQRKNWSSAYCRVFGLFLVFSFIFVSDSAVSENGVYRAYFGGLT